jgi:hypothetical protein
MMDAGSVDGETCCAMPGIIAKAVPVMSPTISATPDNDFFSLVWFKMSRWLKLTAGRFVKNPCRIEQGLLLARFRLGSRPRRAFQKRGASARPLQ